jgi:hypothetical protein
MSSRDVTDAELAELRSLAGRLLAKVDKIITERAADVPPPPAPRPPPSAEAIASVLARRRRRGKT